MVPDKIEEVYLQSQYIRQIFVYGESLKVSNLSPEPFFGWRDSSKILMNKKFENFQSNIIAIVIPDVHVVKNWALEHGMPGTLSELCENEQIKNLIMDDMAVWAKDAGLKPFEQVL